MVKHACTQLNELSKLQANYYILPPSQLDYLMQEMMYTNFCLCHLHVQTGINYQIALKTLNQ